MKPILQIQHLTHTYGIGTPFQRSAVEDMSFDVYEGEFLGVIGHTGSGKSTLIQHLNGLLKPTEGQILLGGRDIWAEPKKIRQVRFRVGLVFQYPEYQLFEETVYKDVAFGPSNQGKTGDELDHCVREAARLVGIRDDQMDKSPFELSGGQKRRVALAGVLAMEPECIVLDEATAMLDPRGRRDVLDTVRRLNRDKGMTVVMITHHMDEAELADRVVVLNHGQVYLDGAPKEIFQQVEQLRSIGLTVPETVKLLYDLHQEGMDVLLSAISVEECADAVCRALQACGVEESVSERENERGTNYQS